MTEISFSEFYRVPRTNVIMNSLFTDSNCLYHFIVLIHATVTADFSYMFLF